MTSDLLCIRLSTPVCTLSKLAQWVRQVYIMGAGCWLLAVAGKAGEVAWLGCIPSTTPRLSLVAKALRAQRESRDLNSCGRAMFGGMPGVAQGMAADGGDIRPTPNTCRFWEAQQVHMTGSRSKQYTHDSKDDVKRMMRLHETMGRRWTQLKPQVSPCTCDLLAACCQLQAAGSCRGNPHSIQAIVGELVL